MSEVPKTGKFPYIKVFIVFLLILGLWYLNWWYVEKTIPADEISNRGIFGDQFGAITSLFSGLAFAGLIITIILQTQELALQRLDLKETRNELKGQKEQLAAQNQTFLQQKFENSFFQLLKFHNDLIGTMKIYNNQRWNEGREYFKVMHSTLERNFNLTDNSKMGQDCKNNWKNSYLYVYQGEGLSLQQYMGQLFILLYFIDSSEISNKEFYANIIKTKLSLHEQLLLCYHSLTDFGQDLKPLIEKYNFFIYLPEDKLLDKNIIELYSSSAFQI